MLNAVGEDALEIQVRENLKSLDLEGENEGDYYTSEEHQRQQQEDDDSDDYEEEVPVDEPSYNHVDYVQEPLHQNEVDHAQEQPLHYNTVEYVQEPIQSVQVPAPEPAKFTYASIVSKFSM